MEQTTRAPSRPRQVRRAILLAGVVALAATGCYAPRGSFDAATAVTATVNGVIVDGWVDDQDTTEPSYVKLVLDGQLKLVAPANVDRVDVAAVVPGAKVRSGFRYYLEANQGVHDACVWAANTGGEEADTFLGCKRVTVGRGAATSYSFMSTFGGQPVKWNGCSVIHYTTRTSTAYPGALEDIQFGIAAIAAKTGLTFHYAGEVSTIPDKAYGGETVGGVPRPLLVGFVTAAESDLFDGQSSSVVGMAGSWSWSGTYLSGRVALEKDRLLSLNRSGPLSRQTVIMHELGHAIGLGHYSDATQIMNPIVVNYADWGAGDMTGLKALSTPGCPATFGAQSLPERLEHDTLIAD